MSMKPDDIAKLILENARKAALDSKERASRPWREADAFIDQILPGDFAEVCAQANLIRIEDLQRLTAAEFLARTGLQSRDLQAFKEALHLARFDAPFMPSAA